jgi:hypothetical protein
MPMRGGFSTQHPQNFLSWFPGVQDIQAFIRDNRNDLGLVVREQDGLKAFLIEIRVPSGGQPWPMMRTTGCHRAEPRSNGFHRLHAVNQSDLDSLSGVMKVKPHV